MKKIVLFLLLLPIYHVTSAQVVADHTIVDMYDKIPQEWVDEVKKMWVTVAGRSHAEGYVVGADILDDNDSSRPSSKRYEPDSPETFTIEHLRISTAIRGAHGNPTTWEYKNDEQNWYTNQEARNRIKAYLQYCHDTGPKLSATMYGWSFDAQFDNPPSGDEYDPDYHVRWAGRTLGGPDGSRIWGLDDEDEAITENSVSMSTYIETVNEYNQYCKDNGIDTKVIFTTGSVDNNTDMNFQNSQGWAEGERGYQQYLKWQYIRDYVNASGDNYLLDYADILCYNDDGSPATTSWTDNNGALKTYPIIHPNNLGGGYTSHIGYSGAERVAKALWWLLARMAGWDGKPVTVSLPQNEVSDGIVVTQNNGVVQVKSEEDITGKLIRLISVNGQTVQKKMIEGNACQLNMDSLPSGMYLLVISLDNPYSKKIIKH